jgi:catechol 2,3-dioxygenase-like lactoylglutathione lyase family enzyme
MNLKLEAIIIPVSDVDRAKKFYQEALGFRVDVDHRAAVYEEALGTTCLKKLRRLLPKLSSMSTAFDRG